MFLSELQYAQKSQRRERVKDTVGKLRQLVGFEVQYFQGAQAVEYSRGELGERIIPQIPAHEPVIKGHCLHALAFRLTSFDGRYCWRS